MRNLLIIFFLTITWVNAQNGRGAKQLDHMGRGWDIRLAVPGEPGNDYPTLGAIPRTTFSCAGREPGYYADLETNCQVFRVCTVGSTYGFQSFLCPNGTLFNQAVFVCDWWMNVDCQNSQQFINNNNNEKFGNLKLGPQLMKDIKKMLTHPMRNPYDKNAMKSNLIVMQEYKPPSGQLFPNGALFAGPERAPNNVLVPSKLISPNIAQNNYNDYSFSASTPEPRYLPGPQNNNVFSNQKESDIFQRQKQSGQYTQDNRLQTTPNAHNGNLISNGHTGRLMQNIAENNGLLQAFKPSQFTSTAQRLTQGSPNLQRQQTNPQRSQYSNSKSLSQLNDNQQPTNTLNKLNPNSYQNTQATLHSTPTSSLPKFSSTINPSTGKELKQNLALVYSFLADSINVAKDYNNIAQQDLLKSTHAPTVQQFQNLNNEQLSQITNQVSQLTSSQYSSSALTNGQNQNNNIPPQSNTIVNPSTRSRETMAHTEQNQPRQVSPYNMNPSQQTQELYASRTTNPNNLNNQNPIYSGQLYQWAVPDVTDKIYNSQSSENLVNNNVQTQNTLMQQSARQLPNINKQNAPTFEVVKAEAVPLYSVNEQFEAISTPTPFNSQENIQSLLNTGNGITAQVQDKIVGTISHPFEENKVVRYKKDQSYLLYSKLDDNTMNQNTPSNTPIKDQENTQTNEANKSDQVTYQLVPSISFELEDEKEQQDILNTFRIDEFGAPREIVRTNIPENKNERKDILSEVSKENISSNKMEQYRINTLYDGPSSYSAPQSSVGSLEARQIPQNNYNSRLEDLDEINSNGDGYPRERPARQFTF